MLIIRETVWKEVDATEACSPISDRDFTKQSLKAIAI